MSSRWKLLACAALPIFAPSLHAQPRILQRLPAVERPLPVLSAGRIQLAGEGADLRRLDFDAAAGALRLAGTVALPEAVAETAAGSGAIALRLADGRLLFQDSATGELFEDDSLAAELASGGDTLVVRTPPPEARLRWRPLDSPQADWTTIADCDGTPSLALAAGRCWAAFPDSLVAWPVESQAAPVAFPPLADASRGLRAGGDLLLALGANGLQPVEIGDPDAPLPAPNWDPGAPPLDARWWRERLWLVALGDSGLALVDFTNPAQPRTRLRRRTPAPVTALALRADTLLVADGPGRLALHRLRSSGDFPALDLLARHASRPLPVRATMRAEDGPARVWLLDAALGLRGFDWSGAAFVEHAAIGLPLPVLDGEIAAGLFAGASQDAGLRYYEWEDGTPRVRGIHPPDPVHRLAWGPDDRIAYVTPTAFVALKQVRRSPWTLLHDGTLALGARPLSAAWCGDRLLVGADDGRLFVVDAGDPSAPRLDTTLVLRAPVRSLRRAGEADAARTLACAGSLYSLRLVDGRLRLVDSLEAAPGGEFLDAACAGSSGAILAGEGHPDRLRELWLHEDGRLLDPGARLPLPAAPLAVARAALAPAGFVALRTGELLALELDEDTALDDAPGPADFAFSASPNPFNPRTVLRYRLERPALVEIDVFDLLGRRLAARPPLHQRAGDHELALDASAWPSGLLVASLRADGQPTCIKLLLLR